MATELFSVDSLEMALAHLYRGELSRSDRWRTRLDTTTNWALTTTAGVISIAFGSVNSPHMTVLVGMWMVLTFLYIEARRYRYYDLWHRRVRLLEDGFWAPLLRREPLDTDALRELAFELDRPHLHLSWVSALQTRLSRAYGSLLSILMLSWVAKVYFQPTPLSSMAEFLERARAGPVPGGVMTGFLAFCTTAFVGLYVAARFAHPPLGELRPRPRTLRQSVWEEFNRPYPSVRRPPVGKDQPGPGTRVRI